MKKDLQTSKKKLTKAKKEIVEKRKEIEESIHDTISVGDIFITYRSNYKKVIKITKKGVIFVDREDNKWEKYEFDPKYPESGVTEWHYVEEKRLVKINLKEGESLKDFHNNILKEAIKFDIDEREEIKAEENNERALALLNKEFLLSQKKDVINIRKKHQILARVLEKQRYQLQQYVSEMSGKIEKMNKVIGQIELYLGINEDIIQIQKGNPANIKEPISLRQQILFMDEETGVLLEQGGLDYKNISQFDDWVTKDKNYEELIPEKKGVVVVRVRRHKKDYYSNDNLTEFFLNKGYNYTYLLIRNGDNLYRIWANIIIRPRLFPTQEEMDIMFENKKQDFFKRRDTEEMVFSYRQNLLLLQGLIDRTEVFRPFNTEINLFKPKSYGDYIKFIRDDEPSLTEGQQTFEKWKKKLNSKIKRGTRIYFCGFSFRDIRTQNYNNTYIRYDPDRFPHYVSSNPRKGIYNIKRIEEKSEYREEKLVCHYNPKDTVWKPDYEDTKRKNSIPFYLYRGDDCVLNYDLITIKEIDYFLESRFDRKNYLAMLPVLFGIKKRRLKEIEWERGFVDNLVTEFKCKKELVWKSVVWWKAKVIWKRPIMSDDAKSLRMIRGRVKRLVGETK